MRADGILEARLSGIAKRHAGWGGLAEAEEMAGAAELREVARGRVDLLAQVAGLAVGCATGDGPEQEARGRQIARLCCLAGADEAAIPDWESEGRRRRASRRLPPFSGGPGPAGPWIRTPAV